MVGISKWGSSAEKRRTVRGISSEARFFSENMSRRVMAMRVRRRLPSSHHVKRSHMRLTRSFGLAHSDRVTGA